MKTYTLTIPVIFLFLFSSTHCFSNNVKRLITTEKNPKTNFVIAKDNHVTPILISSNDYSNTLIASTDLQNDLKNVTGIKPSLYKDSFTVNEQHAIIIGTLGKSAIIDSLVYNKKINPELLTGKWEKFISKVIENPFPGIKKALVIVGSDMRGTAFGVYNLSQQIGVSPWQWWSGVPAKKQTTLYANSGTYTQGEPKVKYRGFYLNLKKLPSSKNNSKVSYEFQENVLKLILRMKGNYLLPENIGESNSSIVENSQIGFLAKKYGIHIKKASDYIPLTKFDSKNKKIDVIDLIPEENQANLSGGPNEYLINESKTAAYDFWSDNTPGIHYVKEKAGLNKIGGHSNSKNYGIYYNYDNVSSNLKWYNTTQIENVWQELNAAYEQGFDNLWIVNVGSIKHKELPIEFFLDFSWNPEVWTINDLDNYYKYWSRESFGNNYQQEIASLLKKYTTYNARLQFGKNAKSPYSLTNYKEAETIVNEYNLLAKEAVELYNKLDSKFKNAFYQIVVFPVVASANLNELMITIEKNKLYKKQNRAATNDLARKILELSLKDIKIREDYNRVLSASSLSFYIKNAFLTKKDEQVNNFKIDNPDRLNLPAEGSMGIAVEGTENSYLNNGDLANLPIFDNYNDQSYTIEIFNTGEKPLTFKAKASENWIEIDEKEGDINKESRIFVKINWNKAPKGEHRGSITIQSEKNKITVYVPINNLAYDFPEGYNSFVESNGYISINPENFSKSFAQNPIKWISTPNVGRSLSGIMAVPSSSENKANKPDGSKLEYNIHMRTSGTFKVHTMLSPSFNYNNDLQFGISIDHQKPQIININDVKHLNLCKSISIAESNGVRILTTEHSIENIGEHTLTFWMVDPGVVLQKIVVETGELKPSYFGPPESYHGIK